MKTRQLTTHYRQRDNHRFALHRGLGFWELTFEGQRAVFKHDQGTLYVACLLLDPPPEPIHAMALALKARKWSGQSPEEAELIQERNLGLDDAEAVRNLRRKQRELEAVLGDELAIEPVKAEARREREEIMEFLRKNSWRSRDNAGRCVRAVAVAIKRFHARLGQGGGRGGQAASGLTRLCAASAGAPADSLGPGRGPWRGEGEMVGGGVLYLRAADGSGLECGVRSAECGMRNIQHPTSNIQHPVKGERGGNSSYRVCGPIQGEVTNQIASGVCNLAGVAGHARRFKNTHT